MTLRTNEALKKCECSRISYDPRGVVDTCIFRCRMCLIKKLKTGHTLRDIEDMYRIEDANEYSPISMDMDKLVYLDPNGKKCNHRTTCRRSAVFGLLTKDGCKYYCAGCSDNFEKVNGKVTGRKMTAIDLVKLLLKEHVQPLGLLSLGNGKNKSE